MISFGIDIGTTTTRATAVKVELGPFGKKSFVPIGQPLCTFTPFSGGNLEEQAIISLLEEWVVVNRLPEPEIGTLLFTGEAQRAPNALAVSRALSAHWGGLLAAQLNPELETVVAAHGAGAVELSERSLGKPVLHVDIGGGTSNLAWIENGNIVDTACLDLGSRKWILSPATGRIERRTEQAKWLETLHPEILKGKESFDPVSGKAFSRVIAELILSPSEMTRKFVVVPWKTPRDFSTRPMLSISGGVADCLNGSMSGLSSDLPLGSFGSPFVFGDLGPFLGDAVREVAELNMQSLHLSSHEGRATALGISSYGFEVSGGSIHATDSEPMSGIPLFHEGELQMLGEMPRVFAVELESIELEGRATEGSAIEAAARLWARRLEERFAFVEGVVSELFFTGRENDHRSFDSAGHKERARPLLRMSIF